MDTHPLYVPSFGNVFHLCCKIMHLTKLFVNAHGQYCLINVNAFQLADALQCIFAHSISALTGMYRYKYKVGLLLFWLSSELTWLAVDETSLHDKGSKTSDLLLFQYWCSWQGPGCGFWAPGWCIWLFFMQALFPSLSTGWATSLNNSKDSTVKASQKWLQSSAWSHTMISNFTQLSCMTFWTWCQSPSSKTKPRQSCNVCWLWQPTQM